MRVVVVGAGQVGHTVVKSLAEAHECTVIDVDEARLQAVSHAYDVRITRGSGTRRETLLEAGAADAELVLACTSRDEVNLVTAMLARRLSSARTVVRATGTEYLEAWRAGDLDVDLLVSTAFETASAVERVLHVPGARHVDLFARGEVVVLGIDVREAKSPWLAGRPLREAGLPAASRVVAVVRDGNWIRPTAHEVVRPGDEAIVMASPAAARAWSRLVTGADPVDDVALFGAGRMGTAIARVLLDRGVSVRIVEPDAARARAAADALDRARVFHATGLDPAFLHRERIDTAGAAVFAGKDDSRNLHAAVLAKLHGVGLTMTVLDDPAAAEVFEAVGVDVTIDPGDETAEKMARFTFDERTHQMAMLEDDRFEVLDIAVRPGSRFAHGPVDALPGAAVGAIVRDGAVFFPDGKDELRPGDRAVLLTEPEHVPAIERDL
ncbi:Trk system potassium transporter TrkA [Streptomyces griseomycini]|uniref:Trk system potassium uptake protein TrkA n=1 Tax=Streptomyces griseomycini TaxID=66895 RepID=A0A7W7PQJ6_9ACTN|nr:Trk system potassium transporter TrkA [Streptomyces griseomycini]MBB4898652.1 trk system potassium uptake protein TrkA [Streptomyces griseomycini]GGQ02948.1 Trk system potassium transport protein TrkA [Streptomyces griseomycini]GGR19615.1 Trk system potassium transport protein TrkA [Streptomyces griseomycini]